MGKLIYGVTVPVLMRARPIVVTVTLLLMTAALAGCMSPSDGINLRAQAAGGGHKTVDARDYLDVATDEARAWNANATLFTAFASEGFPVDLEDPPFLYDSRDDRVVGDGLANAWTYGYGAESAEGMYAVVVDADGTVTYAGALPHMVFFHGARGPGPGGPGTLDTFIGSSEAAAAATANGTVREFLEDHPESHVRLALITGFEEPSWIVHRETTSGFSLSARVDAETGALLDVYRFPHDMWFPCAEDAACHEPPTYPEPPEEPREPEEWEPEPPEDEHAEKTTTLSALHASDYLEIPYRGWGFAATVTVTATPEDALPVEEWELIVYGEPFTVIGRDTGSGALEVTLEVEDAYTTPFEAEIRATRPPVGEREFRLVANVTYGEYLGDYDYEEDWMSGHVSRDGTQEHVIEVEEGAEKLHVGAQASRFGPQFGEVAFDVVGPDGNVLAETDGPGGLMQVDAPAAGAYTIRATASKDAIFGIDYELSIVRAYAVDW